MTRSSGGRGNSHKPVPRRVALEALARIETGGAYANLVLGPILARSNLAPNDRHFVTELVYGTVRMQRACDFLVDRFLSGDVDATCRMALRLGAYQLQFLGIPPHAAVGETVGAAPPRVRGLVNAVLRRVAQADVEWPDEATRLSYPDWLVDRLVEDLGRPSAIAALEAMNQPARMTRRPDGYVQDKGSQWVSELVETQPGETVVDLCAAPGGKITWMAKGAALAVGVDIRPARARLTSENARRVGAGNVAAVAADSVLPPFKPGVMDRVLVDAPCSGLGTLRRRPDARWRIRPEALGRLSELQKRLLDAAAELVRPGGLLVYSVCTLTLEETRSIDDYLSESLPGWEAEGHAGGSWQKLGRGDRLLPQAASTDGMYLLRVRRPRAIQARPKALKGPA